MKLFFFSFSFAFMFSISAFSQHTNFNGRYSLNKEKTDWTAPEYVLPVLLEVFQDKDSLKVRRVNSNNAEGTETLLFKDSVFRRRSGADSVEVKYNWTENNTVFSMTQTAKGENGNVSYIIFETWALGADKKAVKITRNVRQGNGVRYTITGYYDKQ